MTPAVDVLLVTFNAKDDVRQCLASLADHPPRALGRIVVADNASSDGTPDAIRQEWPAVRVLALERNLGFGAANNRALALADAPLVLFLNGDTVVPAGAVDRLIERLLATGAAAAGPRLVDAAGRPEISFGAELRPLSEARQMARQWLARRPEAPARAYVDRLVGRERFVAWVSGACLLARREAVAAAGGFDERYFLYEEDVDLCAAIRRRGGRILFTPAATITHLGGRSARTAPGAARAHYDRSHLAFYEKHAPGWTPWLRWWLRVRGRTR